MIQLRLMAYQAAHPDLFHEGFLKTSQIHSMDQVNTLIRDCCLTFDAAALILLRRFDVHPATSILINVFSALRNRLEKPYVIKINIAEELVKLIEGNVSRGRFIHEWINESTLEICYQEHPAQRRARIRDAALGSSKGN